MIENIGGKLDFSQRIKEQTHTSIKRVLLISPNHGGSEGFQVAARTEPLGLEYVAGAITDIVEDIEIHDDESKPEGWREKINAHSPDIVAISCNYTVAVPEIRKLTSEVRKVVGEDTLIVLGGHAISLKPKDGYTKNVDAIVIGAGEKTFRNLVETYGKTHSVATVKDIHYRNGNGEFVSNVTGEKTSTEESVRFDSPSMDGLPSPRRDLADEFRDSYYMLYYPNPKTLRNSDGCTNKCVFCSGHKFNKGIYQSSSAEKTINQIESIPDGTYVPIIDDFAFLDTKAANQVAEYLIRNHNRRRFWAQTRTDHIARNKPLFEKLHEAGLDMLLVGFESFDPAEIKKVGKGIKVDQNIQYNIDAARFLKETGIRMWGAQIIFPDFTKENFSRIAELNNELGIDFPQFAIYTPLPGTTLYDQQFRLGHLTGNEDPKQFDLFSSVLPTTLPIEEFYARRDALYLETGVMPASRIKQDIQAGLTTLPDVRKFMNRVKKAYDTPRYRELFKNEGKQRVSQKPIEIFSATDVKDNK